MNRLFTAAVVYLVLGLGSGLFYREFTKANDFVEGGATQLSVVHTHLLTLGFLAMLIVLALEKAFTLSASPLFGWFFWVYNAGVLLTSAMMVWHGSLTVLGQESNAAIAGIAGLGHIVVTAGLVLLMMALRKGIVAAKAVPAGGADAPSEASV
ncbi:DUF2871 domain-containing protein [Agromyces sp. NBRC 114283]|uniref:DUF2871 domain-containing protein n=1 Tax=Agromyces sp. NBRC 114283 TaxID=2994521 RepID=UPI0024A0EAB7|nr:DUF2871 domain-containing protein [Agromyces sp. NBRC 114283]GLU88706.1 hypothetical protein Agsp01_09610 [Agromyces sp. NBRC 114283]